MGAQIRERGKGKKGLKTIKKIGFGIIAWKTKPAFSKSKCVKIRALSGSGRRWDQEMQFACIIMLPTKVVDFVHWFKRGRSATIRQLNLS